MKLLPVDEIFVITFSFLMRWLRNFAENNRYHSSINEIFFAKLALKQTLLFFEFFGQVIPVFVYSETKSDCQSGYILKRVLFYYFQKHYRLLLALLWSRMTCSSTFLKYFGLAVLTETPVTYILMYCSASSTAFTAVHCLQFKKGIGFVSYFVSYRTVEHLCLWGLLKAKPDT